MNVFQCILGRIKAINGDNENWGPSQLQRFMRVVDLLTSKIKIINGCTDTRKWAALTDTVSRPMHNTNWTSGTSLPPHNTVVEVSISITNIGCLVLKIYTYIQLQPSLLVQQWHSPLFQWGEMIYDTIIELTSGLECLNGRRLHRYFAWTRTLLLTTSVLKMCSNPL